MQLKSELHWFVLSYIAEEVMYFELTEKKMSLQVAKMNNLFFFFFDSNIYERRVSGLFNYLLSPLLHGVLNWLCT